MYQQNLTFESWNLRGKLCLFCCQGRHFET